MTEGAKIIGLAIGFILMGLTLSGYIYNNFSLLMNHEAKELKVKSCNWVLTPRTWGIYTFKFEKIKFDIRTMKAKSFYDCAKKDSNMKVIYNSRIQTGVVFHPNEQVTFFKIWFRRTGIIGLIYSIIIFTMLGSLLYRQIKKVLLLIIEEVKKYYLNNKINLSKKKATPTLILLDSSIYTLSISIGFIFLYLFIIYFIYGMAFMENKLIFINGLVFLLFLLCIYIVPELIFKIIFWIKGNDVIFIKLTKKVLSLLFSLKAIYTIIILIKDSKLEEMELSTPIKLIELFIKQLIKF